MKSLNIKEIAQLCSGLRSLEQARLNAIYCQDPVVTLEFYKAGRTEYLILDLTPSRPLALHFIEKPPFKLLKKHKPVTLFIKAHFAGKSIKTVDFSPDWGRLVRLNFCEDSSQQIEARLFPHGQNLIASTGEKSISWHKPKELAQLEKLQIENLKVREQGDLQQEWLGLRQKNKPKVDLEKELKKAQTKVQKSIEKLRASIAKNELAKKDWDDLAEKLSENLNESLGESVAKQFSGKYNTDLSPAQNMKTSFESAKRLKLKINKQQLRLTELESELQNLSKDNLKRKPSDKAPKVVEKVQSKRWTLPSGVTVAVGKNAKENVDLLRKAKPWDLWLHLKDFPGAYGIIYRNKNQQVSEQELNSVAQWVIKMSLKNKAKDLSGEKLDLVLTECRYLQLIKGDKLGRVTYKNVKTFCVKVD